MTLSQTRKLTGIKYAAAVLGAFGILAMAPATAFATDNDPAPGGGGGCTHIDNDGYPIPIDDGQDVFVDGKIVSCRGGKITITTAPQRAETGGVGTVDGGGKVSNPGRLPVFGGGKLPVFVKQN
ncbi:hypothetical protein A5724_04060 [Mycobacterium sp. ACS1612]|uniref:hypothetical protein n=1 Tax=Mycobacterium sp. ACS1612 TaxID=1834117 RepID=UPI000801EEBE|nr:hypothetical protein [Mycobacterium sp. ACS1612]OBF25571.1 hypothetical protein A5724_04060 [Mycobacterium sp. ACS1612]